MIEAVQKPRASAGPPGIKGMGWMADENRVLLQETYHILVRLDPSQDLVAKQDAKKRKQRSIGLLVNLISMGLQPSHYLLMVNSEQCYSNDNNDPDDVVP